MTTTCPARAMSIPCISSMAGSASCRRRLPTTTRMPESTSSSRQDAPSENLRPRRMPRHPMPSPSVSLSTRARA
ncbi:Uncharacterised protein [Bordetella pertussis]|nr:Uncharacterised protein [Bordetella pertussis]